MSDLEENGEEIALDPATERVRRKMVRLLVVSISVMLVGLMAVLGAIVYKVTGPSDVPDSAAPAPTTDWREESRLELPRSAEIVSVAIDGSFVLLHIRDVSGRSLLVFDLATGTVRSRVAVD